MKIFSKQIFMDRLRLKRGERSQKVAAAMCEMKQPMYARYESGATLPSAEQIFRLCDAFDCSADYLLGLSDEKPNRHKISAAPNSAVAVINGSHNKVTQTVAETSRKRRRKHK